nr:hypothetical protein GCM10025732_36410 [Glycomyces mayteni]
MTGKPGKVTQREIARIAGVSQTTVSMVLNDRDGSNIRIPDATRERVRRAIEQSTYVADPAARRLAGLDNKILGVFTYESALTPESMDFYGPLLNGIERAAESLGCDLLFFTSSPSRRVAGACSTATRGCAWPTAASCSASRWTARTSNGSWPSRSRSSPSAAATRPTRPCRTWGSTTGPSPGGSWTAPSSWATRRCSTCTGT